MESLPTSTVVVLLSIISFGTVASILLIMEIVWECCCQPACHTYCEYLEAKTELYRARTREYQRLEEVVTRTDFVSG